MAEILVAIGGVVLILVVFAFLLFFLFIMGDVFYRMDWDEWLKEFTNKISDFIVSLLKGRGK